MDAKYKEFLELYIQYTHFKSKTAVPDSIGLKLQFIAKNLLKQPIDPADFKDLDEGEVAALESIDTKDKILLFLEMTNCILGKSSLIDNKQAHIKKDKYFEKWQLCYVSFDKDCLYITRKQKESIPLKGLDISKKVKKKGKKYIFRVKLKKYSYIIGFEKEFPASQVHKKLYCLINGIPLPAAVEIPYCADQQYTYNSPSKNRDQEVEDPEDIESEQQEEVTPVKKEIVQAFVKKSESPASNIVNNQTQVRTSSSSKDEEKQNTKINAQVKGHVKDRESENQQKKKQQEVGPKQQQQIQQEQDRHNYEELLQQYDILGLDSDDGFKIEESSEQGRVMCSLNKPNTTKVVVFVKFKNQLDHLLELVNNIKEWNKEIDDSKIIAKLDDNMFVLYEKHKAYGFNWRCRDFVFVRRAIKYNNQIYILEKSITHSLYPQYSSIVRAQVTRRVTALVPHPQSPDMTLVICKMQMDYRGLNSVDDNRKMALRYLKNYFFFASYVVQKSFSIQQQRSLFNLSEEKPQKTVTKKAVSINDIPPKQGTSETSSRNSETEPHKQQLPNTAVSSKEDETQRNSSAEKPNNDQKLQQPGPRVVQLQSLMTRYEEEPFAEKYMILVVDRNRHEDMYLKHRYDFSLRSVPSLRCQYKDEVDNFIFQKGDWILGKDRQFTFVNKKVIDAQKDVIKFVIRQIGSNIMSGKSVMDMSMPVDIFDNRGLLERNAASMGYAPIFVKQAGRTADQLEQMKLLTTYMISINTLELRSEKPFNPILGETFQCFLADIPLYFEQISHHPPISAYYMTSPQFQYYGNLISFAELGLNSGTGGNAGIINVKFPINKTTYEISLPGVQISGLIYGERKYKLVGKGFVLNRESGLFAEVSFGKDKKDFYSSAQKMYGSDLLGGIFKVNQEFITKYSKAKGKHRFEGVSKKDVVDKLCKIQGSWLDEVRFDDKVYKSLFDPLPYKVEYHTTPLPSNSNFREDLIWKRLGNLAMSQSAKEKLQVLQRHDKKLRKKH